MTDQPRSRRLSDSPAPGCVAFLIFYFWVSFCSVSPKWDFVILISMPPLLLFEYTRTRRRTVYGVVRLSNAPRFDELGQVDD
ncbi:hypothetical protein SODALDRAFT_15508 [Sodiomyces alkalinus F11]|uniref:Uncharacterized protein n=1 Tax=Sodiomyces alkalinus (strain CBS 110278 / VKM F-3762 / F11) TaxID=1314773 RepID=A0A3N2Q6N2_SODAK|nr:hypothetical protein SODALDRAFT_15508 [Sodiomyces alkalinus F11]ROT42449.1 hypothetical protein SODALDRAFT_15508 [Sodiomyces alkalinus F11]